MVAKFCEISLKFPKPNELLVLIVQFNNSFASLMKSELPKSDTECKDVLDPSILDYCSDGNVLHAQGPDQRPKLARLLF